ncbi:MAG: DUF1854 domain-containing protein [Armatimonadetes bacterium]|nr:DUF1854 domain-containing protein [Armatimonadota bacterium]
MRSRDNMMADAGWDAELERLDLTDAKRVRIWHDEFRRLHVQAEGGDDHVDVRPARIFPISDAAGYISFLDPDDREVMLLENPEDLEPDSRQNLDQALGRAYFVPRISEIYTIEDSHGAARWEVETDRGYRVFDVRDREDVRVFHGRRVLLQDADGNRFEVENIADLDERSRRLLDKEI